MITNIPMDEVPMATDLTNAKVLGLDASDATKMFNIGDLRGDNKGFATTTTNPPGPLAGNFYTFNSPGTYTHFLGSDSNPIVIADPGAGFVIFNGIFFWNGTYWVETHQSIAIPANSQWDKLGTATGAAGAADFNSTSKKLTTTGTIVVSQGANSFAVTNASTDIVDSQSLLANKGAGINHVVFKISDSKIYVYNNNSQASAQSNNFIYLGSFSDSDIHTSLLRVSNFTIDNTGRVNTVILNIFNKANCTDGVYANTSGGFTTNAAYSRSERIRVIPGKTIYYNRAPGPVVFFVVYDASNTMIDSVTTSSLFGSYVIPTGADNIIFNVSNNAATRDADKAVFQLQYDSAITTYYPYRKDLVGYDGILLSPDVIYKKDVTIQSYNLFNKAAYTDGSYVQQSDGTTHSGAAYSNTGFIPIDQSQLVNGKLYYIRATTIAQFGAFYSDKSFAAFVSPAIPSQGTGLVGVIDVPVTAAYIVVNTSINATTKTADNAAFQLCYRNLPYVAYKAGVGSVKGVAVLDPPPSFSFRPFADSMQLKVNPNIVNAIKEVVLYNQDITQQLYLFQFGRYYVTSGTDRRWYFIIKNAAGTVVYGGYNSSGAWTRNEDYQGLEEISLYNAASAVVGYAIVDWSQAWPTAGGYTNGGTLANALFSNTIFKYLNTSATTSRWYGKRAIALGDSITAASGNFIGRAIGFLGGTLVANYGIDGSTIAQSPSSDTGRDPMVIRYTGMSTDNIDIVIVAGGTNDCNYTQSPFGVMTDRTPQTFYGALHLLIKGLMVKYIGKQVVMCTPIKRCQDLPTPESTNGNGKTQKDYADAIKEVSAYYGVPCVDMFSKCMLDPFIPEYATAFTNDGQTHPNAAGQVLQMNTLVGALLTI